MEPRKLKTWALVGMAAIALGVACDNDSDDEPGGSSGSGGTAGSSAGTSSAAGSSGSTAGGKGGGGGSQPLGEAGAQTQAGSGGEALGGAGQSGEAGAGNGGDGGDGGDGGEPASSCDTVRSTLLGPIDEVSTGLVQITSDTNAVPVTLVVDASAGGYMAAAQKPAIYLSLASKLRVDVTDLQADTSTAWDVALKRDTLRANGGDSGPGQAQVAVLDAVDFDSVTVADAANADFAADDFIDDATCEAQTDQIGKPVTRFSGWYEYAEMTMVLTPADKVFLLRGADGTSLYKLQITGYYVDVSDGMGGTAKKSAVYSLRYQAL
jgi:hypothetical protein